MSINGFETADGVQKYNYNALDNMPFGFTGETVTVFENVTLDTFETGAALAVNASELMIGAQATLSINGVSVTSEVKELEGTKFIGNTSIAEPELEDTGEAYILIFYERLFIGLVSDYTKFGINDAEPELGKYTATLTVKGAKLLPRHWLEPAKEPNFRFGCLCYPGSPSTPSHATSEVSYIPAGSNKPYTGLFAATSMWQDMRETGLVPAFVFNTDVAIALPSSENYRNASMAIPMITHIGGPGNFRGVVVDPSESGQMYYFTIFDGCIHFSAVSGA